jgi:hypothetical protein
MRLPVMRKLLLPVFILFVLVSPGHVMAATVPSVSATPASQVNEEPKTKTLPSLATMKVKEFEKLAGQKLTLKEKIAFKIFQSKLKKENRKAEKGEYSKRSKLAFILGILSIATLPLIPLSVLLSVITIILASKSIKANDMDKKAKTALTLAVLSLGIIVVGLLIYAIFVSDGAFKLFVIN